MRVLVVALVAWVAGPAAAQRVPWPDWAKSVEAVDDGVVVRAAASDHAPRRGTVHIGTHMPLRGRTTGLGCGDGRFVQVGDHAYVCERDIRPSVSAPGGVQRPMLEPGALLPHEYLFVVSDGTPAYARPADLATDEYESTLGENFGLVATERLRFDGMDLIRGAGRLYVLAESLRPALESSFAGVELGEDTNVGWVTHPRAPVRVTPRGAVLRRARRFDSVVVADEGPRNTLQLAGGGYISARHVARVRIAEPPTALTPGERWIDVDVQEQVLTAYEGTRPVFATLVSTGTRGHDTPSGEFRIWVKLATSDMNDTDREDVEHNYSIEAVPWVQYFEGAYGFHAAFWHEGFGERRSRGCVNLSPRDARRLFEWTAPTLPAGWTAVLPAGSDRGTLVRVR